MPKSTLSALLLAASSSLLLLLLLLSLASASLAQPPSFLPPPPTGNPACIAATNNLNTGACHVVATKLRSTASSLKDATCEQLAASEAARLVDPECCADVRSFVASGCGCDPGVLGLLGAAGVPAAALAGGVKLATVCAGELFFFYVFRKKKKGTTKQEEEKKGSLFSLSRLFLSREKKNSLSFSLSTLQASACASEALGGPLENTCAGAVACKASSSSSLALSAAPPASVPVASASAAAGPLV